VWTEDERRKKHTVSNLRSEAFSDWQEEACEDKRKRERQQGGRRRERDRTTRVVLEGKVICDGLGGDGQVKRERLAKGERGEGQDKDGTR